MAILPHHSPALPCAGFLHPAKVMGQDFSLAPRGRAGMSLNFLDPSHLALSPPLLALPSAGFSCPTKVMGQDFSPAPRSGTGMGLDFLDSPHLTLPLPRSAHVTKDYNCKLFIL